MMLHDTLQSYGFDPQVARQVATVSEVQSEFDFDELIKMFGLAEGPLRYVYDDGRRSFDYLYLQPLEPHDERTLRVLHSQSGMSSEQTAIRAMRLFAASPHQPLLAMVRGEDWLRQRLSFQDAWQIGTGKLELLHRGLAGFLTELGVKRAAHYGYADAADIAVAGIAACAQYDIEASSAVLVEPFGIRQRRLAEVAQVCIPASCEAVLPSLDRFIRCARLSRYALVRCLSAGDLAARLSSASSAMAELRVSAIWVSDSLACPAQTMQHIAREMFGSSQFVPRCIDGLDQETSLLPHMYAALFMQGERDVSDNP